MSLQRVQDFFDRLDRIQVFKQIRLKDRSNPLEDLTEAQFVMRFRLKKDTAVRVIQLIHEDIKGSDSSHGTYIPTTIKFLAAMRFFATGSYQLLIGDAYNLSQPSICTTVHKISRAIAKYRSMYVKYPTETEAVGIRQKFYELAQFPGKSIARYH